MVLFPAQSDLPAYPMVEKGIKSSLEAGTEFHIEYFIEHMDSYRNSDEAHKQLLLDLYHNKFSRHKIDLVIAYSAPSLKFVIDHRDDLFTQTPVVFSAILREQLNVLNLGPKVTGVLTDIDYAGLLETALKIHPRTRHVAIVNGASKTDLFFEKEFRKALAPYANRLDFIYLTRLPMGKLLEKVRDLPEYTVVLYYVVSRDGEGKGFPPWEAASMVAGAAKAPVYGCLDSYFGHGIVGGRMSSMEMTGVKAGEMALRILRGEKPSGIPMTSQGTIVDLFDWRQFKRWGIREDKLPPGSEIRFRVPSIWEEHRGKIIGAMALIMIQAALIFALVVNLRRRRLVEESLKESEAGLSQLTGRIISAQEEELRRLSRELHDDLTQRLAALSLDAALIEKQLNPSQFSTVEELRGLRNNLSEVADEVHDLSRRLHPSILDDLGLVQAAQAEAAAFMNKTEIDLSFKTEGLPDSVPKQAALCLYRVIQEGLQNIAKHSEAKTASITLQGLSNGIRLLIEDKGIGFDPEEARKKAGIGLSGMRERVRLINGKISFASKQGHGTKIEVFIPTEEAP